MTDFASLSWPEDVAARYRRAGYWGEQTFGDLLRARATACPERVALIDEHRAVTFRELDTRAERLCSALWGLGLRPRDRVLVQLPNVAEFFEVLFALFRLGVVPVLALPALGRTELGQLGVISEAVAYFGGGSDADRRLAREIQMTVPTLRHVVVLGDAGEFRSLRDLDADPVALPGPGAGDVAVLQLSGGTTAVPKLIPRTHADYIYASRACAAVAGFDEHTVYLAVLPVAHNFPLASPGVLAALDAGATSVLAPSPSPEVAFQLIGAERVTHTALVPSLALVWLAAAEAAHWWSSSLRVVQIGGAPCGPDTARRVGPVLGATLQQVFGMAEGLITMTRLDDPEEVILHTQGRPVSLADEVLVATDEDRPLPDGMPGHLLTRGPYTIWGYYRAPEHNARAFTTSGFYRTGDVVSRRPDGNLVVEGRAKDQINRGGEKIAAAEIEGYLRAHPGVYEAALVGVPDAYLGERTCAFIVARGERPQVRELLAFVRSRGVAAYKVPDRVEFLAELPHTGVGKVAKQTLRELAARPRTIAAAAGGRA